MILFYLLHYFNLFYPNLAILPLTYLGNIDLIIHNILIFYRIVNIFKVCFSLLMAYLTYLDFYPAFVIYYQILINII